MVGLRFWNMISGSWWMVRLRLWMINMGWVESSRMSVVCVATRWSSKTGETADRDDMFVWVFVMMIWLRIVMRLWLGMIRLWLWVIVRFRFWVVIRLWLWVIVWLRLWWVIRLGLWVDWLRFMVRMMNLVELERVKYSLNINSCECLASKSVSFEIVILLKLLLFHNIFTVTFGLMMMVLLLRWFRWWVVNGFWNMISWCWWVVWLRLGNMICWSWWVVAWSWWVVAWGWWMIAWGWG